jgi:hypothetical protein
MKKVKKKSVCDDGTNEMVHNSKHSHLTSTFKSTFNIDQSCLKPKAYTPHECKGVSSKFKNCVQSHSYNGRLNDNNFWFDFPLKRSSHFF